MQGHGSWAHLQLGICPIGIEELRETLAHSGAPEARSVGRSAHCTCVQLFAGPCTVGIASVARIPTSPTNKSLRSSVERIARYMCRIWNRYGLHCLGCHTAMAAYPAKTRLEILPHTIWTSAIDGHASQTVGLRPYRPTQGTARRVESIKQERASESHVRRLREICLCLRVGRYER